MGIPLELSCKNNQNGRGIPEEIRNRDYRLKKLQKAKIGVFKNDEEGWQYISLPPAERDDGFFSQAENFIRAIRREEAVRTSIQRAKQTLVACLAAKESYNKREIMKL